jgi:hypothetical protein
MILFVCLALTYNNIDIPNFFLDGGGGNRIYYAVNWERAINGVPCKDYLKG